MMLNYLFIVGKYQCVCQMFCQEVGLNCWKVVFIFMPSVDNLEVGYYNKSCGFAYMYLL